MQTVLVVGKYYPPYFGGIELVTKQCVDSLLSRYKVVVLCHNNANTTTTEEVGDLSVIRCATPFAPFRQPISFVMALRVLTCRADLIHFHAPNFWAAALVGVLRPRVPLLVTHHADVEGRAALKAMLMPLYKLLLRRSTNVIVSSLKNYRLSKDLECEDRKVVEIPFGLNPDVYTMAGRRTGTGEAPAGRDSPLVFGFCGRLVWYKGLDVLVAALHKVRDARLVIIGDGPLRESVEAQVRDLHLEDRVSFRGRVSDAEKLELFKEIDVFVLPSTHVTETFGISQMEAQMCGIPCISSNLPTGVSDVVDHGVTGLLVEPGSVDELGAAMSRMITDDGFRRRCAREARKRALRLFSESAFRKRYLELINQIMDLVTPARSWSLFPKRSVRVS